MKTLIKVLSHNRITNETTFYYEDENGNRYNIEDEEKEEWWQK